MQQFHTYFHGSLSAFLPLLLPGASATMEPSAGLTGPEAGPSGPYSKKRRRPAGPVGCVGRSSGRTACYRVCAPALRRHFPASGPELFTEMRVLP